VKRLRLDWIDYQGENSTIESFVSRSKAELNGWEIYFNDPIPEAEAWLVIEGSGTQTQSTSIPPEMLFFGTGDTIWKPDFYNKHEWRLNYLRQFDAIYSCHRIALPKTENAIPFHHWMINSNTGQNVLSKHERDYEHLASMKPPAKKRDLSVICSTKAFTPEHAKRLNFVEALKTHFGDRLDWYGNGKQPIKEKWDALIDYKYTIAIENQSRNDVITEKLLDPFLTFTYPIYFGAPNVFEYFSKNALLLIDIQDIPGSIAKIEDVLDQDIYPSVLPELTRERIKVLNDYNFIQRIIGIVDKKINEIEREKYVTRAVVPMINFQPLSAKYRDRISSMMHRAKVLLKAKI